MPRSQKQQPSPPRPEPIRVVDEKGQVMFTITRPTSYQVRQMLWPGNKDRTIKGDPCFECHHPASVVATKAVRAGEELTYIHFKCLNCGITDVEPFD